MMHCWREFKREMPGIKIVDWNYSGQMQKKAGRPRRSNYELALIKYLNNMADGRVSVTEIAKTLGMSQRTMANRIAKMDDPGSAISKAMIKAGVRYEVSGKGQRQRAFFVKDSIRVRETAGRQVLNAINP